MNEPPDLSRLEDYARARIAAENYPDDTHTFRTINCPECGLMPMAITISHHTGSKEYNFRGQIYARCANCGRDELILSFTGQHRRPEREERPRCDCGNNTFYVAELERIELLAEGFPFFDEGVMVGQCADCGRLRVMVYTD